MFEAMTKPEHVKRWWGRLGEGYSVPVARSTFASGGAWRFVNRHPEGRGRVLRRVPRDRAAEPARVHRIFEQFPDSVSVVTSIFTDEGGKTRFTATVRYPSLEVRDMVIASGMARGAGISYDRSKIWWRSSSERKPRCHGTSESPEPTGGVAAVEDAVLGVERHFVRPELELC